MSLAMIEAAAVRLKGQSRVTPLLNAPLLDAAFGKRIFAKAECLQVTGSFKFRGAWSAVSALPAGARGVLACSSGNHGQGVALAAARHGLACVVVMPSDAPEVKIANTRAYGAEVVLYDRATEDRDALGAALCAERGLVLVKPFDDPQVIAGQGTVGLEIADQAREAGVEACDVLVCCGGGGLSAGIAQALEARAPQMRLRTVEPAGFDDMARSLAAGVPLRNAATSGSVCDAILTPAPGALTFPVLQRLAGPGLVVSDDQALQAMALAFAHLRIVLEPGGAVALAAALFHDTTDPVICVASGGNADPAVFRLALERFG
jgi:threonine dehydratase